MPPCPLVSAAAEPARGSQIRTIWSLDVVAIVRPSEDHAASQKPLLGPAMSIAAACGDVVSKMLSEVVPRASSVSAACGCQSIDSSGRCVEKSTMRSGRPSGLSRESDSEPSSPAAQSTSSEGATARSTTGRDSALNDGGLPPCLPGAWSGSATTAPERISEGRSDGERTDGARGHEDVMLRAGHTVGAVAHGASRRELGPAALGLSRQRCSLRSHGPWPGSQAHSCTATPLRQSAGASCQGARERRRSERAKSAASAVGLANSDEAESAPHLGNALDRSALSQRLGRRVESVK